MRSYLIAFFAPVILYCHSLTFYFVYDDSELIVSKDGSFKLLTPYYEGLPYFRPIPAALFALERTLFGLNPIFFHLTNLLLAGVFAAALYKLLSSSALKLGDSVALALTLICVFHPITSSTVYMLSGREALLSAIFLTLTMASFLHHHYQFSRSTVLYLLAALLCREASLAIVLILCGFLFARWLERKQDGLLIEVLRISLVCIAYLTLRSIALHDSGASPHMGDDRRAVPLSYIYALSSIWSPTIDLHYEPEIPEWLTGARMAILAMLCVLFNIAARQSKALSDRRVQVALVTAIVCFAPTANIFAQETPFDERHLLVPMIAVLLIVLIVAQKLWGSKILTMSAVVIGVLGALSFYRGYAFHDDDRFFANWIDSAPERSKVLNHLAAKALVENDLTKALELANRSIALRGSTPGFLYRARIRSLRGDLDGAAADLTSSLEIAKDQSAVWCTLGLLELQKGNKAEADRNFSSAASYNPSTWCTPQRFSPGKFWGAEYPFETEMLKFIPISSREELRFFREAMALTNQSIR